MTARSAKTRSRLSLVIPGNRANRAHGVGHRNEMHDDVANQPEKFCPVRRVGGDGESAEARGKNLGAGDFAKALISSPRTQRRRRRRVETPTPYRRPPSHPTSPRRRRWPPPRAPPRTTRPPRAPPPSNRGDVSLGRVRQAPTTGRPRAPAPIASSRRRRHEGVLVNPSTARLAPERSFRMMAMSSRSAQ